MFNQNGHLILILLLTSLIHYVVEMDKSCDLDMVFKSLRKQKEVIIKLSLDREELQNLKQCEQP